MEQFTQWVQNWGYGAVFLGSLVEGESVILIASSMAYLGHLSIYKIMIVAFTGTVIADQALFLLGRHYGPGIFDRFPKFKKPANRAFALLHRFDIWFIIGCRFVYGIRVTSAIVIGAAQIPLWRFIPLNILSAVIWTLVSCIGGYMLGDVMREILDHFALIQKYFFEVLGLISVVAMVGWFAWRWWRSKGQSD